MAASLESINLYQELDSDSIDMINREIRENEEIEILTEKVKKAKELIEDFHPDHLNKLKNNLSKMSIDKAKPKIQKELKGLQKIVEERIEVIASHKSSSSTSEEWVERQEAEFKKELELASKPKLTIDEALNQHLKVINGEFDSYRSFRIMVIKISGYLTSDLDCELNEAAALVLKEVLKREDDTLTEYAKRFARKHSIGLT